MTHKDNCPICGQELNSKNDFIGYQLMSSYKKCVNPKCLGYLYIFDTGNYDECINGFSFSWSYRLNPDLEKLRLKFRLQIIGVSQQQYLQEKIEKTE